MESPFAAHLIYCLSYWLAQSWLRVLCSREGPQPADALATIVSKSRMPVKNNIRAELDIVKARLTRCGYVILSNDCVDTVLESSSPATERRTRNSLSLTKIVDTQIAGDATFEPFLPIRILVHTRRGSSWFSHHLAARGFRIESSEANDNGKYGFSGRTLRRAADGTAT
jgi:hypothetical protein